jgi:branched-chain amino acid aminotransferase
MNDIFPQGYAWIDSKYVELAQAKIPILDWGFLRSDATYDVVHVWKGRFFRLDKHIDRFFESTKKLRMPCQLSRDELKKILANCVVKGKLENAYVEMIQTRGMSPKFVRDPRLATPRVMAFAVPFGWILKQEDFEKGLNVLLTDIKRIPPSSVDPTIKNYHWMDLVTGMLDAYEKGNDTAVLVDENNNITEGPGFNLFCINASGIFTPDHGVLEGITRQSVFDLAKELHLPIMKKSISVDELYNAEELFATSTAGGIMPITKVSGKDIGKGSAGSLTRQLHKLYWEKHSDDSWSTSISDILTN